MPFQKTDRFVYQKTLTQNERTDLKSSRAAPHVYGRPPGVVNRGPGFDPLNTQN